MAGATDHVVLVVHGVANRTPDDFQDETELLTRRLAPRVVRSVFWGDLGPTDAHASFPVIDGSVVLGTDAPAPVVRTALHDALADNPDVDAGRGGWRRILDAVDARLDHVSPEALTVSLRRAIARTVRDVEAYERNGEAIRARLDEAYQAVRARAARVDVVAHSLGSLVATEWLFGAPAGPSATEPAERHVDTLVTFGAQVGMFVELRGLQGSFGEIALPPAPVAITLPLRRWYNVWHALDPLAFAAAPVFNVTGKDGPLAIEDYRLAVHGVPDSAAFHVSYWRDEHFLSWLAAAL